MVSTDVAASSEDGNSADNVPGRLAALIAMGLDGVSVSVGLVLASFAAMAPLWLFSTVNLAGFTSPGVISIAAILAVGFAILAPLAPKLICLRNHPPGLLLGSALIGAVIGLGKGGSPLLFGGELALLIAGESFGVDWSDPR
jgi:hypothetical protein